jgi:hypothetical protein
MPKFRTVNLSRYFNRAAKLVARSGMKKQGWHPALAASAAKMPRGEGRLWGIPFALGPGDMRKKGLVALERDSAEVEIKLSGNATHLCFLHFTDMPGRGGRGLGLGDLMAEYVLRYKDGKEHVQPVRVRFEVHAAGISRGGPSFASAQMGMQRPVGPKDAKHGAGTGVMQGRGGFPACVYALENPKPDSALASVVLRLRSNLAIGVLGLTLYDGPGHPLRHLARRFYRLTLPPSEKATPSELSAELDMGSVTTVQAAIAVREDEWTKDDLRGLGTAATAPKATRKFLVEATGSEGATLKVKAGRSRSHEIPLGEAFRKGRATSSDGAARLELIHSRKTWLHVNVIDAASGNPTPTRIHFRGANGEYLPPYGHHAKVNSSWFEDYAGDLQLGGTSYAYVPGSFQIELPVGEVYVEIAKGFEYKPVRKRLNIRAGQRELSFRIDRWADWRKEGWVTADTHVHFISPQTAWLEGQAEGLNLINLLASQWGRLFTNVADITGKVSGVSEDDTIVWVGTENRNHMLGHMSMLGAHGDPVYPMCAGGPNEAYLGDPDMVLLTEWAQKVKEQGGVSIRPHFPGPSCEEPVYFALGQLDGAELRHYANPDSGTLDEYCFLEWYKYLNCGYRVAAVGGTDKMSAGMPVGGARTYAKLDPNRPFTFKNWGAAIRAGRTFTTSGPLIDLSVDGHAVGDEIKMPRGGGAVELEASATCAWPMNLLEVVVNGKVVAKTSSNKGTKSLKLRATTNISKSSWVAARCGSRLLAYHCWPIHLGAHTSPVYVNIAGEEMFSPSDASYMVTLIDGGLTYLDTLSVRYDEQRHKEMKAIFQKARRILQERLRDQ